MITRLISKETVDELRLLKQPPVLFLSFASLVNMIGSGLYLTGSLLFFTKTLGLSVGLVGIGLTVAAIASLPIGPLLGHAADHWGPRPIYGLLLAVQAAAMFVFPLMHSILGFSILIAIFTVAQRGAAAANGALLSSVSGKAERTRILALLRAVVNLGLAVGVALAGVLLAQGGGNAYSEMILIDGLTFVAAALLVIGVPAQGTIVIDTVKVTSAMRNGRYLLVSALCGVVGLQYDIISFGLPLWIVDHTTAPRVLISILLLTSTGMVVALQVRATRDVSGPVRAAVVVKRATYFFVVSCMLFGFASWFGPPFAIGTLILAIIIHTIGEIRSAAGTFELSFGLAPDSAQGQYQGAYGLVTGLIRAPAALLITGLAFSIGLWGWVLLAAILLSAGVLLPQVVRLDRAMSKPALGSGR